MHIFYNNNNNKDGGNSSKWQRLFVNHVAKDVLIIFIMQNLSSNYPKFYFIDFKLEVSFKNTESK